jgi:hypothetical protein
MNKWLICTHLDKLLKHELIENKLHQRTVNKQIIEHKHNE